MLGHGVLGELAVGQLADNGLWDEAGQQSELWTERAKDTELWTERTRQDETWTEL